MAKSEKLRVVDRKAGTLVGPFTVGNAKGQMVSMYQFSELIVCDWVINSDVWVRAKLVVPMLDKHVFTHGKVTSILASAWPSSIYGDGYQDAGWAIDMWEAQIKSENSGDRIDMVIEVAAIGKGTAFGRVGYNWTAYVTPR